MIKKSLCFLVLLVFVSTLASGFSEVLTYPWGDESGKVSYRLDASGCYGPSDFLFYDRTFYLLDRENSVILGYDTDTDKEFIFCRVDPLTEVFTVRDGMYAFFNGSDIKIFDKGQKAPMAVLPKPDNILVLTGLVIHEGIIYTRDEKGYYHKIYNIYEKQFEDYIQNIKAVYQNGEFVQAFLVKEDANSFKIIIDQIDEIIFRYDGHLGSAQILYVSDYYVLVLTEELLSYDPIKAKEMLLYVDYAGNVTARLDIPFHYFSWFPNNIRVYDDELFYLLSSKNGIHVLKESVDSASYAKSGELGDIFSDEYHYNDFLLKLDEHENEGSGAPKAESSITRTQILNNAVPYESAAWTAKSSNLSYGIKKLPDGAYIRTPSWVTVGSKKGVPYKWGGWTKLSTFLSGVSAGKYAGDNYTSSVSWTDNYCVGVDCSGFVSRAWNLSTKYGTSTLPNISTAYSYFSSLKRGDIVNKASSHVRLVINDNPSGTVNTIEASGTDWKVSYRNFSYSSLSGYSPRYFKYVINDSPPATNKVMKVTASTLNIRSGPSTGYTVLTTIANGQKFVSSQESGGWHKLHMPSGDGFSYGWGSGTYLTSSPEYGYVKVINTTTLNVRTGPGTSYPIITTISKDQLFAVIGSNSNGWYEFSLPASSGATRGWASGSYLQRYY